MESLNVGFGQAAILKVLSDHGEMAQRRLAEEIRVTPATVCGTLKRMERAGLIDRGYERLEEMLNALGADICRVSV